MIERYACNIALVAGSSLTRVAQLSASADSSPSAGTVLFEKLPPSKSLHHLQLMAGTSSADATRVKLSENSDVFQRLDENKTVLHLLCALNRAEELANLLRCVSADDAALAFAQVRVCMVVQIN
jgi:hypothetical protein